MPRDPQQEDDDAGCVVSQRRLHRGADQVAEEWRGERRAVDVRHVDPQDECGLRTPGSRLQQPGVAGSELNRVGGRPHDRLDRTRHVLDPGQKARLVEYPVVDRDVEAATIVAEQASQPGSAAHDAGPADAADAERTRPSIA